MILSKGRELFPCCGKPFSPMRSREDFDRSSMTGEERRSHCETRLVKMFRQQSERLGRVSKAVQEENSS
jgi:hypothetical protein